MKPLINEFHTKVVGTSFYSVEFDNIQQGDDLEWKREPQNPYDRNAISLHHSGKQIGHIPKETAASLAESLDAGNMELQATVTEVTGGGSKNRGINILLTLTYNSLEHLQTYNAFEQAKTKTTEAILNEIYEAEDDRPVYYDEIKGDDDD